MGRRHDPSGSEVCVVYDPLRHRFFELSPVALAMLERWRLGARRMLEEINAVTPFAVTGDDLKEFVNFLIGNELLARKPLVHRPTGFARLEHAIGQLMFFRVPLVHPDRAMTWLSDFLAPLLRPGVLMAMGAVALLGLALVVRQWDLFVVGFRTVFNAGGALAFVMAVALAKVIHELGHALAAKRTGCAVPAMGVAVMFGAPLLYTDLSDTWRLESRRQRLLVAAGGILAETALAAVATWGWLILPDGSARSACFFLATAAWATTLLLNASPFMRFDGYFMLSDIFGVPNLQERAFAIGRWALRRLLWGTNEACPDESPPRLVAVLLAYAWITWIVRGGIFLGLAFAAFHVLPKVIAVPILLSELWVLVFRPVVRELMDWWQARRTLIGNPRGRLMLFLLAGLVLWSIVPQSFRLALPAVYAPQQRNWIYSPRAAILVRCVPDGARVKAGDVLAEFRDPELDHQASQSRIRLEMAQRIEDQLATGQASARDLAAQRQRIAEERATSAGIAAQQEALTVRAPIAGRIAETSSDIRLGAWRTASNPLFLLISDDVRLTAYAADHDLDLIRPGGMATFYPSAIDFPSLTARVETVEAVPTDSITEPLLASLYGGPIEAERDSGGRLVPKRGEYRVTAQLYETAPVLSGESIEGRLVVNTRKYSLLGLVLRRLYAVAIRESGV